MNTPAHLLMGAAAFARPAHKYTLIAALMGGILPDLSLYLMAATSILVMGISPSVVFDELYFSPAWQQVFAIDNSFVLWGVALAAVLWWRSLWAIALTGSALMHLVFDFLLHHDDARRHFWPLSDWVFVSPVSYWDRAHYGHMVGPVELLICVAFTIMLWMRYDSGKLRAFFALLLVLELAPAVIFGIMFATNVI